MGSYPWIPESPCLHLPTLVLHLCFTQILTCAVGDQNSDLHVSIASNLPNHPLPSPPMNFIVTFLSLVHHVRYRRAEGYKMYLLICSSWHYSEPHLNIIEEYSTPLYGPSLSSLKNWYVLCTRKECRAVWKAKDNQIDSIHAVPRYLIIFILGGFWESYCVVQALTHFIAPTALRFMILQSQHLECWDCRYPLTHSTFW